MITTSRKIAIAATLALATFGSTIAVAQPRPYGDRDDRRGPPPRVEQRGDYGRGDDRRGPDWHGPRPGDPGFDRGSYDHRADFRRGGRLPGEYRSRQYVVDDWRGHHLSAPPRGYNWVQVGADYALVAIATGVIASVLLNQ